MKDEKKFVVDTLKQVYGVTDIAEEEFTSDEDDTQVDDEKVKALFSKLDKEKVTKLKTKSFDDGAKAREKKVKSEIESTIKTKFGITDFESEDFDALIDHAVSLKPKGKLDELTPDAIEALPHVIGLKNNFSKQLQAKEAEFNQKLTAKEQEVAQKQLFGKVAAKAIADLKAKNPVLPEDATKAERRLKKDLIEELNVYGWLEQNGEFLPLGQDGKQLTTANDVLVTYDDIMDEISENFEFADAPPATPARTAAGLGKNGKQDPPKREEKPAYTGKIPDNEKEYHALINNRSLSVAERVSIRDQYKKKKGL